MRVIFQPDGGFGQAGGFIEVAEGTDPSGTEPVYQNEAHLHIYLTCRHLTLHSRYNVSNRATGPKLDDADTSARTNDRSGMRRISGVADIERARWGRFSLSFLGSAHDHTTVDLNIREDPDVTRVYVAGTKAIDDIDLRMPERFFVEVVVSPGDMTDLLEALQQPGAALGVSVQLSAFPNFFATWSPSVGEGRVVKFLDSRDDIANAEHVPESFWRTDLRTEMLSDEQDSPVTLSVSHRLIDDDDAAREVVDDAWDDDLDADLDEVPLTEAPKPVDASPASGPAGASVSPVALLAARGITRAIWGLSLVILVSAMIVVN